MSEKLSVEELEALLNSEDDTPVEILPNGEIKKAPKRWPDFIDALKRLRQRAGY